MAEVTRAAEAFEAAGKQAAEAIARAEQVVAEAQRAGARIGPAASAAAAAEEDAREGGATAGGSGGPAGLGPVGGQRLSGSLEVSFAAGSAPPPAFAGVCVVHRFPEYLLIDFGSIDPLQMEPVPGGQKALLQHVGRVCLPESAARRLLMDLAGIYGTPAGGGA